MKLSELGSHSLDCPQKPTGELDAKVSRKDLTVLYVARITAADLTHCLFTSQHSLHSD